VKNTIVENKGIIHLVSKLSPESSRALLFSSSHCLRLLSFTNSQFKSALLEAPNIVQNLVNCLNVSNLQEETMKELLQIIEHLSDKNREHSSFLLLLLLLLPLVCSLIFFLSPYSSYPLQQKSRLN
jgi:hypothetical protein